MTTTGKGKAYAFVAVIMACVMALSLSPLSASADTTEKKGITIFGVDSLEMSADVPEWEIARAEGLDTKPVFIELFENGKQVSGRVPYTPQQDEEDTLGAVAHIITLQMGTDASPASVLGTYADDQRPVISFKVYEKAAGGQALPGGEMTVYPVYARLTAPGEDAQYRFLGTRTASLTDTGAPVLKNLQVGTTYYEGLGEGGEDRISYSLVKAANGMDNAFEAQRNCYVVTYELTQQDSISGGINYVNPDGVRVKSTIIDNITEATKTVTIEPSFYGEDGVFYRRLHNLSPQVVTLSAQKSTYTVQVIPVTGIDMQGEAYTVTVEYVDQSGQLLWTDDVNVKNYGYQYTLPESFSMMDKKEVKYYRLTGVDAKARTAAASALSEESATEWTNPLMLNASKATADFRMENDRRKLTARYSSDNVEIPFTVVEVDGAQNQELGRTTHTITPDVKAADPITYQPEAKLINGTAYEPWAGNTSAITYCWDDIAQGKDLLQYVYYVPEGYVADSTYDLTVQYMNIANSSIIKTETVTVDPQLNDYLHITGESQFTQNGSTYLRLSGQENGFYHSYYTNVPNRTYTIYYRDANDTINANTVINRTQIIETTRDVVVPGTVQAGFTAAPAAVDAGAAGDAAADVAATEAGVTPGDGAVVINDDANPLANLDGVDTTTERTIADNETPLSSGVGSEDGAFPWGLLVGGILVAGIAGLGIAFITLSKRSKKSANDARRG